MAGRAWHHLSRHMTGRLLGSKQNDEPPLKTGHRIRTSTLVLLTALCWAGALGLSLAAAGDNVLPGDLWLTRQIQRIDFPGIGRLERAGYYIGSTEGFMLVGLAVLLALAIARRLEAALLIAGVLLVRPLNALLKELIGSPRPSADLVNVATDATTDPTSMGFPSGHTMSAALLYGALIYLAAVIIRPRRLRLAIQAGAAATIILVALSRIYSGAHWPSDTLGGALWACAFLGILIWAQRAARHRHRAERS